MDPLSAFRTEVLRPIVTIVVPGSIATAPFVLLARYYFPQTYTLWEQHPSAFVTILTVCVLAVGFILEDLGGHIEKDLWDHRIKKKYQRHDEDWYKYLQLRLQDEIIGQRYIQDIKTRMKFELSMVPALLIFLIGLIWTNAEYKLWSTCGSIVSSIIILIIAAYLAYESFLSAEILSKTRKLILDAASGMAPKI
ncbi:MAG: hypothetical protein LAO21_18765 [Acidobacteriia bacterium]|nr:hypothetical protein [Terriglobia bacterium]